MFRSFKVVNQNKKVPKLNRRYFIYWSTIARSENFIKAAYGSAFWENFKKESKGIFQRIINEIPDIGESVFSLSYKLGPSYIAWCKAFIKLKNRSKKPSIIYGW